MNDKNLHKIKQKMVRNLLRSSYLNVNINLETLSDKEKLIDKLDAIAKGKIDFIMDHRPEILKYARNFKIKNEIEFSMLFYGLYFEHTINSIISYEGRRRNFSIKTKHEILRTLNLESKFTWLLEVLQLPKFNNQKLKMILKVTGDRNAFVHYKFKGEDGDQLPNSNEKKDLKEIFENAEKAVKYIKSYEIRYLYKGKKSTVNELLKKHI